MKKFVQLFVIVIGLLLSFQTPLTAQDFDNGTIGMEVSDYGRVRVYTPTVADTMQIDRLSLLAGESSSKVFDYYNDAENVSAATTVSSPVASDYEIVVELDNSYSGITADLLIKINIYGWSTGGYAVIKHSIYNTGSSSRDFNLGNEVIAKIGGTYGLEVLEYIETDDILKIYRPGDKHVGIKILSHNTSTYSVIDWYDGYNSSAADLYGWLTAGSIDTTSFESGADGAVGFLSTESVTIPAGGGATYWVGVSVGTDEAEIISEMSTAETKYSNLITSVEENTSVGIPAEFELSQNYPNPFNPVTNIKFSLPSEEFVKLRVYNTLGQEVAELINGRMAAGNYTVPFNASDMPSGIYFYSIKAGDFSSVKKMILSK